MGLQKSISFLTVYTRDTELQIWTRIFPFHVTSLNVLTKKAMAEVSCHNFLPSQQRQTQSNVIGLFNSFIYVGNWNIKTAG